MAQIELSNITKRFKKVTALDNISLNIKNNEFFVLFGPAGAGKTTILKTIAGVEFPDEGYVKIDGNIVNLLEPAKRNVSMVFENYALYPHFTVFDNIASPMRSPLYKTDETQIKRRVENIAALMKIDHLLNRLPSQLSNGQRQRVALGRCLVRKPNVFLMDEPLAHLDAKLRHFMRAELKEMQTAFNTTTIYVTHDYMEALSLGDRIAVINHGKIEQIGTGDELYYTPSNEFVAKLIGEPEINIFKAQISEESGRLKATMQGQDKAFYLEDDVSEALMQFKGNEVDIGVRGNDISFSLMNEGNGFIKASVYSMEPIGNKAILIANINGQLFKIVAPNDIRLEIDSDIYLKINTKNLIYFDTENKTYITRHYQKDLIKREGK